MRVAKQKSPAALLTRTEWRWVVGVVDSPAPCLGQEMQAGEHLVQGPAQSAREEQGQWKRKETKNDRGLAQGYGAKKT